MRLLNGRLLTKLNNILNVPERFCGYRVSCLKSCMLGDATKGYSVFGSGNFPESASVEPPLHWVCRLSSIECKCDAIVLTVVGSSKRMCKIYNTRKAQ